ncbi:MAG: hypothetical protein WCI73_09560, partial [Phycisphaerae bacterium]
MPLAAKLFLLIPLIIQPLWLCLLGGCLTDHLNVNPQVFRDLFGVSLYPTGVQIWVLWTLLVQFLP